MLLIIIMGGCFCGQLLSFLLHEPSFTFKTFKDIDKNPKVAIYAWNRQGRKSWLADLGETTGQGHYVRVAARIQEVPNSYDQVTNVTIEDSVFQVNERQLNRILYTIDFLGHVPGEESHRRCQRIKSLPNREGLNNRSISRSILKMMEAGLVTNVNQRSLVFLKKVNAVGIKAQ